MGGKKKYLWMALLFLLMWSSVLGVQAAGKSKSPGLVYLKTNTKNVKPGQKVKVRMKLSNGKAVYAVQLIWRTPLAADYKFIELNYHKASREWRGDIKIEKGFQNGLYRLAGIYLYRKDGRMNSFLNSKAVARGRSGSSGETYRNLDRANFKVKGSKVDLKAPKIDLNTLQVSSRTGKVGEKLLYSVKCSDQSKIRSVRIIFEDEQMVEMKYSNQTKAFEAQVELPEYMQYYVLRVLEINAEDIHGNSAVYMNRNVFSFADKAIDMSMTDVLVK